MVVLFCVLCLVMLRGCGLCELVVGFRFDCLFCLRLWIGCGCLVLVMMLFQALMVFGWVG